MQCLNNTVNNLVIKHLFQMKEKNDCELFLLFNLALTDSNYVKFTNDSCHLYKHKMDT